MSSAPDTDPVAADPVAAGAVEIARATGLPEPVVRGAIAGGLVPGLQLGDAWFVSLAHLRQWLDAPMPTTEAARWQALLGIQG